MRSTDKTDKTDKRSWWNISVEEFDPLDRSEGELAIITLLYVLLHFVVVHVKFQSNVNIWEESFTFLKELLFQECPAFRL